MKGDFSKDGYKQEKHFHDVRMQQGRVLLDSDWNEQVEINAHRTEAGTEDIIGQAGAPLQHNSGFKIEAAGTPVGTDVSISAGHFYVDGILCEQDKTMLFSAQPDYNATALPKTAGKYVFYLDAWQRHITVLEDTSLREVALGLNGPDTTTRNKTVWQVKCFPNAAATCAGNLPDSIIKPPNGTMKAKVEASADPDNPCGLVTSGGYRRLENQLYHVEVHFGADARKDATFKWARNNASILVTWMGQDPVKPENLLVSTTGRDELLGMKIGDWVELIDDKTDLLITDIATPLALPGILAQLVNLDGNTLIVNPAGAIFPPGVTKIDFSTYKNPRIRRWDSVGALKMNTADTDIPKNWIELEDGIFVQFSGDSFRSGDYWHIPARTATANIEWPKIANVPQPQSPRGIRHHYAKLAIMELLASGAWKVISDCRPLFPALTELTALQYIGGDGQEALPAKELPNLLQVGVTNGNWPVANASIKFEVLQGGGNLVPVNAVGGIVITQADGLASCHWTLGNIGIQQVKVSLIDDAANVIGIPLIFDAKVIQQALFYISGDGQEAMPSHDLLRPIVVGVAREQFPDLTARVRFELVSGGGVLSPASVSAPAGMVTSADGTVSCDWQLGASGNQQVKATLLDTAGNAVHLPITFTASLSVAENVAYTGGTCNDWSPKPATVADALTQLCKRGNSQKGCSVSIGDGGQFASIAEAFDALKDEKDICMCLIPGQVHEFKGISVTNKNTVRIAGCNVNVKMTGDRIAISATKIIFDRFNLSTTDNRQAQIILVAAETDISDCTFAKRINDTSLPFVQITPPQAVDSTGGLDRPPVERSPVNSATLAVNPDTAASDRIVGVPVASGASVSTAGTDAVAIQQLARVGIVRLHNNRFIAEKCLALGIGIAGWVENNIIEGDTQLLYSDNYEPLNWPDMVDTQKAAFEKQNMPLLSITQASAVLYLKGNALATVTTNNTTHLKIPSELQTGASHSIGGFHQLHVLNNSFNNQLNSFVGKLVSMSGNHFNNSGDGTSAFVLGLRGVITENIGEINGSNNNGDIETLFAIKKLSDNLIFTD